MGELTDKIAIVTGASRGLGREIALGLHREGAVVVCSDLDDYDQDTPDSTHNQIVNQGGRSIYVKANITQASDVEALVKAAAEKYGRLDIMVNNAGVLAEKDVRRPIWDFDEAKFNLDLNVNVNGTMLGIKYASKQMVTQEPQQSGSRGRIVNVGSVYSKVGGGTIAGYVASKHAVLGLTKSAAMDCAPKMVNVNAVCPGYMLTEMTESTLQDSVTSRYLEMQHPLKGFGQLTDVVNVVVYLASDRNTWMTGEGVSVDGGFTAH